MICVLPSEKWFCCFFLQSSFVAVMFRFHFMCARFCFPTFKVSVRYIFGILRLFGKRHMLHFRGIQCFYLTYFLFRKRKPIANSACVLFTVYFRYFFQHMNAFCIYFYSFYFWILYNRGEIDEDKNGKEIWAHSRRYVMMLKDNHVDYTPIFFLSFCHFPFDQFQ